MYLGMDGTGVPMRAAEVAGGTGQPPDGSAKTREAKVVTVWTAESRDAEGTPMRDPGSVTYSAAIESAATADTSPDRSDFARARPARSHAARLPRSLPVRGAGRWLSLDLEHRPGTVPPSYSDPRSVSRQRSFAPELLHRSSALPAKVSNGPPRAAQNWMMANCRLSFTRSIPIPVPVPRQLNARSTSFPIALACATLNFAPKVSVLPLVSSKRVAK